ncbi:hypothetical protein N8516_05165 [Candidatus Thioglobus sp.]|nr:hypothetical protein [Candidatus Thioglobus sp.]
MLKALNIQLFNSNINSILLIFIFCALVVSFISATKISKINITTLDLINFDPKSVHIQSLSSQSFNPKSLHMQSLYIKNLDIENLNTKVFDIESLNIETLDGEDADLKRSYLRSIDLYKSDINADSNIPDSNINNYNINLYNLLSELIDNRSVSANDLKKIALSGFFETTLGKTQLESFKTIDNGSLFEQYKILVGKKPIYKTTEGFDVLVNPIGCTNNSCDKSIKFIKFY